MKIVFVLQIVLSVWHLIGGAYVLSNYEDLASNWAAANMSPMVWMIFGLVQLALSVGLLVSAKNSILRKLAFPSAVGLLLISLSGLFIYSAYTGFPGVLWALIPAALLAFVACKRK